MPEKDDPKNPDYKGVPKRSPFQKAKALKDFQVKGEPKPDRKVSKPKVNKDDQLSSAHKYEKIVNDHTRRSGGRA